MAKSVILYSQLVFIVIKLAFILLAIEEYKNHAEIQISNKLFIFAKKLQQPLVTHTG